MRKTVALSIAALSVITTANAAENLSSMFSEGKTSGQIRMFSISRTVDTAATDYTRKANAIGGHLKFETADLNGLSFGTAFYTTNGFALGDKSDLTEVDPTLLGKDNESYSILGELYAQYTTGNTTFKMGRQKLNTPLAGSDDARMLPNLFEAYLAINKDIKDTTIIAGHVTRFAQGTFGRVYNGGVLSVTSGYSLVDSRDQVGKFVNMGDYAIGQKTDGVTVVSATYTGVENLKVQLWDYYAHDILNAIYAQADYKFPKTGTVAPYAAVQFLKEDDIGDELAGNVDVTYWGVKAGAKFGNANAYVAYSQNDDESGVITPWGGMPAFTQGMVTRHQFLADTEAVKVAGSYNWKDMGVNLSTAVYYAEFDVTAAAGYSTARTTKEPGFDIKYYPEAVKNLQVRFRANFPDDFATDVDWDEYRLILNYNF
jgi:hypothetical protein